MTGPDRQEPAAGRLELGLMAAGAAGLVIAYALPGGAYDAVVRGQFGVAVWWALGLGLATGLLPRARPGRGWIAVAAGWALLVALTVVAFGTTASDERTTLELARVLHHGGVLGLVACLVSRRSAPAVIGGLTAGAVVVCGVALGSRLLPSAFPEDLGRRVLGNASRLSHPLNYWNALGAWAAMAGALSLALGAHARGLAARAAATAAIPAALVVAYLTYSRGSALGVAVGVIAVLVLSRHRGTACVHLLAAGVAAAAAVLTIRAHPELARGAGREGSGAVAAVLLAGAIACAGVAVLTGSLRLDERLRLPRRVAAGAVAVALVALAVAGVAVGPEVAERAYDSFTGPVTAPDLAAPADPSRRLTTLGGTRRLVYSSALDAGSARPWAGVGPGTFEFWWNAEARNPEFVRDAHSLYLEAFAELGWPGVVAIVLLVGGLVVAALLAHRRLHATGSALEAGAAAGGVAVLAVFAVQAGVDWLWEATACTTLALLAGGAVVAGVQPPRIPAASGRSSVRALRALVAAAALVAVLAQLPTLVSTSRLRASQEAVAEGRVEEAAAAVADAIDAQPWAASPYAQRALMAEREGRLRAAEADLRRSIAREPLNWRYPLLLSRVLAERGDVGAAVAAYRRARGLRPLSAQFTRPAAAAP